MVFVNGIIKKSQPFGWDGRNLTGLSQLFVEFSAAENVEVQMVYGLTSIGTAVGNHAVTVADAGAGGDQGDIFKDVSDLHAGFFGDILDRVHVHFRNHENVNGCLRIQVLERKNLVIFIYFGRRDEACGNFTKNTIFHNGKPFFRCIIWVMPPHRLCGGFQVIGN